MLQLLTKRVKQIVARSLKSDPNRFGACHYSTINFSNSGSVAGSLIRHIKP